MSDRFTNMLFMGLVSISFSVTPVTTYLLIAHLSAGKCDRGLRDGGDQYWRVEEPTRTSSLRM